MSSETKKYSLGVLAAAMKQEPIKLDTATPKSKAIDAIDSNASQRRRVKKRPQRPQDDQQQNQASQNSTGQEKRQPPLVQRVVVSAADIKSRQVFIPTRTSLPPAKNQPRGLVDYSEHFSSLHTEVIEPMNLKSDDPRYQVMLSLVDGMADNVDLSMRKKREVLELARDFFEGKVVDGQDVKALAGMQQAKTPRL